MKQSNVEQIIRKIISGEKLTLEEMHIAKQLSDTTFYSDDLALESNNASTQATCCECYPRRAG